MPNDVLPPDWKPLEVTGDAVPWSLFAKTKEIEKCTEDADGFRTCLALPGYTGEIKALHGKEVTLMGFMFPLEPEEKQKNFLLGPYPLSCPFEYHVGPAQVVEVFTKEPISFSYDPITIRGTFDVKFNEETNVFYYLRNTRLK